MFNLVVYNIVIGAYYYLVLVRDIFIGLAVIFGRTEQGLEVDFFLGLVLCFYDVIDIVKKFEDVQDKCFLEGIGSEVILQKYRIDFREGLVFEFCFVFSKVIVRFVDVFLVGIE